MTTPRTKEMAKWAWVLLVVLSCASVLAGLAVSAWYWLRHPANITQPSPPGAAGPSVAEIDGHRLLVFRPSQPVIASDWRALLAHHVPPVVHAQGHRVAAVTADGQCICTQGSPARPLENPVTLQQPDATFHHVQWDGDRLCLSGVDAQGRGSLWIYQDEKVVETLTAAEPHAQDYFALHFAIRGRYLIAARPLHRVADVFVRSDQGWQRHVTLDPHKGREVSFFPYRVDIADNGQWAVLSCPTDTHNHKAEAGSVTVMVAADAHRYEARHTLSSPTGTDRGAFGSFLATWSHRILAVAEQTQTHVFEWRQDRFHHHSTLASLSAPFALGAAAEPDQLSVHAGQRHWSLKV